MVNPNFSIQPSQEADMPRCAEIMSAAFASEVVGPLLFGPHTAASWAKAAAVHWRVHMEHMAAFPSCPYAIKCVHTDPVTGAETIVGTAEWAIYDRALAPGEEEQQQKLPDDPYTAYLAHVEPAADRAKAEAVMAPLVKTRRELARGRPHGFLSFMAVDGQWRRQGAASACVRWGMDRCRELGIPAYLEATEDGRKAYEAIGWEVVDLPGLPYPPMMWWPEGVKRWTD
ncbi:hypothetical protein MY11210_003795 [Beauveria gryllotalpidicola]